MLLEGTTGSGTYEPERCSPDCGCGPDACAADGFLPAYVPNDFRRNVTVLNNALENITFAFGVIARLNEEAFLAQDEA